MFKAILGAVMWLAPQLSEPATVYYAQLIAKESARRDIDPLLVTALIKRESRFSRWASKSRNYGLMQVRVSKSTNPEYLGREHLVKRPRLNIYLGVKWLRIWRNYHYRVCKHSKHHPWWSHYQWGRRVKNPGSGLRVKALYERLKMRFGKIKEVT